MTEIWRDTEENEAPDYYSPDIDEYLDKTNIKRYQNNSLTLSDAAYDHIEGSFLFRNLPDKKARVRYDMRNALTEYVVGKILTNEVDDLNLDFDNPSMAPFLTLHNLVNSNVPFISGLQEVYLKSIKYLAAEKIFGSKQKGKNKKVEKVINPITGRKIRVDKGTYKKMYGDIKLRKIEYKELSTFSQISYDISENCAVDFLTDHEGFKLENLNKILKREISEDITYIDLIKIYDFYGKGITIYDMVHNVLEETGNDRIFKIYGDHLYVLNSSIQKDKRKTRTIASMNDIDKYKNNRLIVTSEELFDSITEKIRKDYIMINYNEYQMPYKSNVIIFDPYYEVDKHLLNEANSKCKSVYNMIDSDLALTGTMNKKSFFSMYQSSKIRFQRSAKENDLLIDMNGAYPSQLFKEGIIFGVPSINDYWQEYDSKYYQKKGLYFVTLKSYDDILAPMDDVYTFYEVEILKKENRIKEIKFMFIPYSQSEITKDKIEFLSGVDKDRIRAYIGWLLKSNSWDCKRFDTTEDNKKDIEALKSYYGSELSIGKDHISINKIYERKKTGIMANITIKALSNIDLYNMNKTMLKLNKNIVLNTVRTDSLGYVSINDSKQIKKPENLFKSGYGFWKVENKVQKVLGDYKYTKIIQEPILMKSNISAYEEKDVSTLLNESKSFIIYGNYGTGKTYSIADKIVPHLQRLDQKYIIASITSDNSDRINGQTLASIFNGRSNFEINNFFEGISYLIIDEATLLNQEMCVHLDYVKSNLEVKFILVGDENQNKGNSFVDKWDTSLFLLNIGDFNMVEYRDNWRLDRKTSNLLEEIKLSKMGKSDLMKFVFKNFQSSKLDSKCKKHVCRLTRTISRLDEKDANFKCSTIKDVQGSTIIVPFMIHDIQYMNKEQIITAISRGTSYDNIYFKIPNGIYDL